MGFHGIINANYEILYNKQINKRNHYFLTAGPLGAGFSFKKYYFKSTMSKNNIVSQPKDPKVIGFLSFTTFYGRYFLRDIILGPSMFIEMERYLFYPDDGYNPLPMEYSKYAFIFSTSFGINITKGIFQLKAGAILMTDIPILFPIINLGVKL